MPLYEYQCPKCGLFELIRKFSDEPVTVCPTCGSEVQKLASAPAFHLKGTGWYVTDYAKKPSGDAKAGKGASEEGKSAESKPAEGKSPEAKSGEGKSDAKSAKDTPAATAAAPAKKTD